MWLANIFCPISGDSNPIAPISSGTIIIYATIRQSNISTNIFIHQFFDDVKQYIVENDESKRWKNIVLTLIRIMVRVTYIFIL